MVALSAQDVLAIWERGEGQSPPERGLALLGYARPGESADRLARLTIGERDQILLALRRQSFGPRLDSRAGCPECGQQLEFSLSTEDLIKKRPDRGAAEDAFLQMTCGEFQIRYRFPNSADLAEAARAATPAAARDILLERCIAEARRSDATVPTSDLPENIISALEERMSEEESGGEILLQLACPECGHNWSVAFDIVSFFYAEISTMAKRLLQEVHCLAATYGWSEKEILDMSAARRRFYLDRVIS